jgi:hypothetical protein
VNAITVPSADTAAALTFSLIRIAFLVCGSRRGAALQSG